jgi:hypothetical protein
MIDVDVQLKRLQRHFEHSRDTYDEVSLLDLAHSLRVWSEMPPFLEKNYPAFSSTKRFRSGAPPKKVVNAAKNAPFVFAYLAGPLFTRASNGQLIAGPTRTSTSDFSSGCSLRMRADGIEIAHYAFVDAGLDPAIVKAMASETTTRLNFRQWLGSEAIKLRSANSDGKLTTLSIARHNLIKRVANTMGASHPESDTGSTGQVNSFDEPIRLLMDHKVGGLPLPYFVLMKCAYDILEIAPDLLKK